MLALTLLLLLLSCHFDTLYWMLCYDIAAAVCYDVDAALDAAATLPLLLPCAV